MSGHDRFQIALVVSIAVISLGVIATVCYGKTFDAITCTLLGTAVAGLVGIAGGNRGGTNQETKTGDVSTKVQNH